MAKSPFPNSLRKFLRKEKSRLRRKFSDAKESEEKIKEMMKPFLAQLKKENKN